jgi:endonuclease/exonuclease/phosphatase family metal-dependent hydrolase
VIIGGDFNMIRYIHEKSLGTKYTIWLDMLNNFINDTKIIELIRGGSLFTWTNKQQNPIRSNLDKIFVSKSWDQHYLRTRVMTMTRVGSDHNPLILDNGEQVESGKKMFRMESAWLGNTKFKNHLLQRWPERNM